MTADANRLTQGGEESETAGAQPVKVALVLPNGDDSPRVYDMFEAVELNGEGAFLAGEVFLEVGELVTLQLTQAGQDLVKAQARVVGLERGARNGMAVVFRDLGEQERRTLKRLADRDS